ncbi:MAG: hypothetical protein Q9216_002673 [Gyalolechia sp. 2 TL-2023]
MGLCNATRSDSCTLWLQDVDNAGSHPKTPADPDIAGIGIVFAFIATSFVTIVVAHISLFLRMIRRCGNNAIDRWISTKLQRVRFLQVSEERTALWQPILERLVMALSDQQLLVGISILLAGFATHLSISAYHFSIAYDLAWFSSNTHLASLGVLQAYLTQRPSLRTWRVCLMLIIFVGLIVATVLQGHQLWYSHGNFPAHCLFNDLQGNITSPTTKWIAVNIALLLYGYVFALAGLYRAAKLSVLPQGKPGDAMRDIRPDFKRNKFSGLFSCGLKAFFVLVSLGPTEFALIALRKLYTATCTCLSSSVAFLCFNVFWFTYGLRNIIIHRKDAEKWIDGDENAWTFGQITAVLLLSSLILTLRDLHAEQKAKLSIGNASHPIPINENIQQPHSQCQNPQTTPSNQELDSYELEPVLIPPTRVDTEAGGRGGTNSFSLEARCLKEALDERMSR